MTTRNPVVAGQFYPGDPEELRNIITSMLADTKATQSIPKAIIAPHAGFIYSGPIAASAYAGLTKAKIKQVVLLGPAHRHPFIGLAAPKADVFATPLGDIKIDHAAINSILELPQVEIIPEAHAEEHSLEVQLPFLQIVLADFTLVPLVVGNSNVADVAEVLLKLWDGPETLIIVSSDLSHYHDYKTAQQIDKKTAQAIVDLDVNALGQNWACGHIPIQGLLQAVKGKNLKATLLDLRNSGDTAGPKDQVVGYGAFHFG